MGTVASAERDDNKEDEVKAETASAPTPDAPAAATDAPAAAPDADSGEGEAKDDGECGFCTFMKAGPCGVQFKAWEDCIEEAEKVTDEVVVKCRGMTESLMTCMESFKEYYGVVIEAGKQQQQEQPDQDQQQQSTDQDQQQQPNPKQADQADKSKQNAPADQEANVQLQEAA